MRIDDLLPAAPALPEPGLRGVRRGIDRRSFLVSTAALFALPGTCNALSLPETGTMYGLIGKMNAVPGKRDALISILLDGVSGMPGCRSYVVAKDPENPDAIWITEVWESKESHQASLSLPSVRAAIAEGRPLIAGFSDQTVTEPVGGHGLT